MFSKLLNYKINLCNYYIIMGCVLSKFLNWHKCSSCCCQKDEQTKTRQLFKIYSKQLPNRKEVQIVRI